MSWTRVLAPLTGAAIDIQALECAAALAAPFDARVTAAFAPADRVLADGYQGAGLDFFLACRPALKADVEDLLAWGRLAVGEQRGKFLEYVNDGDLSSPLSRALRQQGG